MGLTWGSQLAPVISQRTAQRCRVVGCDQLVSASKSVEDKEEKHLQSAAADRASRWKPSTHSSDAFLCFATANAHQKAKATPPFCQAMGNQAKVEATGPHCWSTRFIIPKEKLLAQLLQLVVSEVMATVWAAAHPCQIDANVPESPIASFTAPLCYNRPPKRTTNRPPPTYYIHSTPSKPDAPLTYLYANGGWIEP